MMDEFCMWLNRMNVKDDESRDCVYSMRLPGAPRNIVEKSWVFQKKKTKKRATTTMYQKFYQNQPIAMHALRFILSNCMCLVFLVLSLAGAGKYCAVVWGIIILLLSITILFCIYISLYICYISIYVFIYVMLYWSVGTTGENRYLTLFPGMLF